MQSEFFIPSAEAPPRFRSLELTAKASLDGDALGRAAVLAAERSGLGPDSFKLIRIEAGGDNETRVTYKWRFWWMTPVHWRDDLTYWNGETAVMIARPDASLAYVPMLRTLYTSEESAATTRRSGPFANLQMPTVANRRAEFPLLHAHLGAAEWDFETVGATEYVGRVARRLRATRRPAVSYGGNRVGYWEGIEEYECLLDDELQILLSLKAIFEGRVVAEIAVEHLRADAAIPAETFAFVPPAGTPIMHVPVKQ